MNTKPLDCVYHKIASRSLTYGHLTLDLSKVWMIPLENYLFSSINILLHSTAELLVLAGFRSHTAVIEQTLDLQKIQKDDFSWMGHTLSQLAMHQGKGVSC